MIIIAVWIPSLIGRQLFLLEEYILKKHLFVDAPSHDRAITFKSQLSKFLTTSHAIRAISAADAVLVANWNSKLVKSLLTMNTSIIMCCHASGGKFSFGSYICN